MDIVIKLTRKQLYEQVWATPITKLAKEYRLSDVGLSKLCKRHLIPIPGRGYWAKKEHNRILPTKPKLSPLRPRNMHLDEVIIRSNDAILTKPEIDEITQYEKASENKIVIDYEAELTHPVVIRTAKSLRSAKPNHKGIYAPKAQKCLPVFVCKDSIERASHIMDTLINAFEARGAMCAISYYKHSDTEAIAFELNNIKLEISLEEIVKRIKHIRTPQEDKRVQRDRYYRFKLPEFDYIPTGRLKLSIEKPGDTTVENHGQMPKFRN